MQIAYSKDKVFDAEIGNTPYYLGKLLSVTQSQWYELARAESWYLRKKIHALETQSPIYVMGLARAGTTLLLETLCSLPGMASHRYLDYPFAPVPYIWRSFLKHFASNMHVSRERSHFDGMQVTAHSPEAFEEMLWMHFFPQCYTADSVYGLDEHTRHAQFETFYHNHIKKLLLAEGGNRYIAKGNYNIGRLDYLRRLYPDARFVVAIRHPSQHIASLIKQHRMFSGMQKKDPRLLTYMKQSGHFEFGLDRRTLRFADDSMPDSIHAAWNHGDEVTGWAMYWNMLYARLARQLNQSDALKRNVLIVKYEDLCASPKKMLEKIAGHCNVDFPADLLANWEHSIQPPTYYTAEYSKEEIETIARYTHEAARHFGYDVKV